MRDNVIDYAEMRKEFLKRQKNLRRKKVAQDQELSKVISLTYEQNKLALRKKEFWKYLVNDFVSNKKTEEIVNQ